MRSLEIITDKQIKTEMNQVKMVLV